MPCNLITTIFVAVYSSNAQFLFLLRDQSTSILVQWFGVVIVPWFVCLFVWPWMTTKLTHAVATLGIMQSFIQNGNYSFCILLLLLRLCLPLKIIHIWAGELGPGFIVKPLFYQFWSYHMCVVCPFVSIHEFIVHNMISVKSPSTSLAQSSNSTLRSDNNNDTATNCGKYDL